MTDSDIMPLGKHKGKRLQNVPASYLMWLYDQPGFKERNRGLADYIDRKWDNLEMEAGRE